MKAKLIKESMYANEEMEFAQKMYSLEEKLENLNTYLYNEWETDSGELWRELGVEDWESAFKADPMASIALEEQLRSIVESAKAGSFHN